MASVSTADVAFGTSPKPWRSWDEIPSPVRAALTYAEFEPFEPIVAGAVDMPTVVDADGLRRWSAWAWCVEDDALTLLHALPGAHRHEFQGPGAGPWRVKVSRHGFVEVKHRLGSLAADPSTAAVGSALLGPDSDVEVIDFLPASVRRQVRATVSCPERRDDFMFQDYDGEVPTSHRGGILRIANGVMIVVSATREIKVRRGQPVAEAELALAHTSWQVQALTARLGSPEVAELVVGGGRRGTVKVVSEADRDRYRTTSQGTERRSVEP